MEKIFWFNGDFCQSDDIHLVEDRGYLLGDGVFTTFKSINNQVQCLKEHVERLIHDASVLYLCVDVELLKRGITAVIKYTLDPITMRITLSRQSSGRGLHINGDEKTNILITAQPYCPSLESVSLTISPYQRFSRDPLTRIKHLGYQTSILARHEAQKRGFDDALLLNEKQHVCCGAAANFFYIFGEQLYTPPLSDGCLPGITRGWFLHHKKAHVRSLHVSEISKIQGAFLTNSLINHQEIKKIDHYRPRL
jgi:branched-chain amino acid aminotransferase